MAAELVGRLNQRELPVCEIDTGIALRRPDAHFPPGSGAGPAGRDVRHAAVRKMQAGIGHIFVAAEQGNAQRFQPAHGRPDQSQQEIQIVNHQIQYDADIGRPACERAQALALDELGLKRVFLELLEGGIETFNVSDLDEHFSPAGAFDEAFGLIQSGGERFFDQKGNARTEKFYGDGVMPAGGHGENRRVNQRQQRAVVAIGLTAQSPGHCLGLVEIHIDDTNQLDLGERGQDARVLLAKVSDADHGDAQTCHTCQAAILGKGRGRATFSSCRVRVRTSSMLS